MTIQQEKLLKFLDLENKEVKEISLIKEFKIIDTKGYYTQENNKHILNLEVKLKKEFKNIMTQELNQIDKYFAFRSSAGVWNRRKSDYISCGQILDDINDNQIINSEIALLYLNIKNIWENYHLNNYNAGTIKQTKCLENFKGNDYTKQREYLEQNNLLIDNGYKYGSNWLLNPIPEKTIKHIVNTMIKLHEIKENIEFKNYLDIR